MNVQTLAMLPVTAEWLMPAIMAAAVVGIGMILTISIRAKIARRNAGRPTGMQQVQAMKQARTRDDINVVAAEMLDLAQRLAAQLDDKAERLEQLLEDADARLEALRDPTGAPPEPPQDRHSNGAPAGVPSIAPPRETPPGHTPSIDRRLDPLTRSVYELADAGEPVAQIARQLNEQIGKVELILALRDGG